MTRAHFVNALVVEWLDNQQGQAWYRLREPFGFVSSRNEFVPVPSGYTTNMASVPRPLRFLFHPAGTYGDAAVVHDRLCCGESQLPPEKQHHVFDANVPSVAIFAADLREMSEHVVLAELDALWEYARRITSKRAAEIMLEAMSCAPRVTHPIVRRIVYGAVRAFGPRW